MKYPFRVFQMQAEQHTFWVAKSTQLNGCIGQGDSIDDAINELSENESVWLSTAKELGITIPSVVVEQPQEFSGKLTLRIAPSVHKKAAMLAKRDGISLNQYINDAVVAHNSELSTASYVSDKVKGIFDQFKMKFLNSTSFRGEDGYISFLQSTPTINYLCVKN